MSLDLIAQSFAGAVVLAGTYSLIGLSYVIVFRASRLMNFATGQILVLAGFVTASMLNSGWNYWIAVLVALAGMVLLGALTYRFVLRPLAGQELFAPVVATLGLAVIIEGLIQIIWGPHSETITAPFSNPTYHLPLGVTVSLYDLLVPALALLLWLAVLAFLRWTKFGGRMRAANESTLLASQSGMGVYVIFGVAFAISFVALGLAGITYGQQSVIASSAIPIGLVGLIPAMLGGLDSVGGVVLGSLIVALVQDFSVLFLGSDWSNLTVYVILLVILAVRPNGLFGSPVIQRV